MKPAATAPRGCRVEQTRQSLLKSLTELIVEKGYDRTTIADVLQRADVGRTTFYSHFDNKDDLLLWPIRTLPWCLAGDEASLPDVTYAFAHVLHVRHVVQSLRGTSALAEATASLRASLLASFENFVRPRCQTSDDGDAELATQLVARALTGALMELFAWWVEADMPESPATMNAWFEQLGRRMLGMRSEPVKLH